MVRTDSGLQKAADLSAIAGAQYLATNGTLTTTGYPCTVAARVTTAVGCAQRMAALSWVPGTQVNFVFGTAQVPGAFNLVQACGTNGGSGSPSEQQLITCFKYAQTYAIASDNSLVPNSLPNSCGGSRRSARAISSDRTRATTSTTTSSTRSTRSALRRPDPAYDTAQGSGSGATYHIVGFAEMQLANPAAQQVGSGNKKSIQITGTFVQELAPSDIQGTCGGGGQNLGALRAGKALPGCVPRSPGLGRGRAEPPLAMPRAPASAAEELG